MRKWGKLLQYWLCAEHPFEHTGANKSGTVELRHIHLHRPSMLDTQDLYRSNVFNPSGMVLKVHVMCVTFTVLWIFRVWDEHMLMFPFGQNMRRLGDPREIVNKECENFPHGFPLHHITLESDRAPCFHLHNQKGTSVPPAIIKRPIQPSRDDRITLRPKTKLSLPLVSPVPPILHFRCLSGHTIWASSAFKSSCEFHIYKLGSQCQMRSNHFGARWHGKETAIHLITNMCTLRMIWKLNFTFENEFWYFKVAKLF